MVGPILLGVGIAIFVGSLAWACLRGGSGPYDFSGLIFLFPIGAGLALAFAGAIVWAFT